MPESRSKAYLLDHLGGPQAPGLAMADLIETLYRDHSAAGAPALSAQATLTTTLTGADNDLVFTAAAYGPEGNDISITYTDPNANSAALRVEVDGSDIEIFLATSGAGAITTTADDIKTALAAATSIVTAADSGGDDGTGAVTALAKGYLTGGTGTLAGEAEIGDRYTDTDTGIVYVNVGTKAAPTWFSLGLAESTKTTAVTADTTPPVLTFTGGLNLISNTNDANDIVHLPTNVAADIGKEIEIYAVEGFELRSADASATLNNVIIGATNECAFAAGTYAKLKLVADNTWLSVISTLIDGTQTKLVPDAI